MFWGSAVSRLLRPSAWAAALALFVLPAIATAQQTYRGSVPIARASANFVELAPDVKVYPGESVTIGASGSANVNQHNYEKRRCKYFGLKCWYENRSRTQVRPAGEFEIAVELVDAGGNIIDSGVIDQGRPVTLAFDLGGRFEQGASIQAYIATFKGGNIDRRSCGGRPSYCSSGDLTLTINASEKEERMGEIRRHFGRFGANNVPADRIRSRDYIDSLLTDNDSRALEVQTLIATYIREWVPAADANSQGALIQLIQFALGLSNDHANLTILNRARMDAYAKQGAYEQLENYAAEEVNRLNEGCAEQCSIGDARDLAAALRSLATAQAEKRARLQTSDITLAVATLNRGIDALEGALDNQSFEGLDEHLLILANLYEDGASMLSLIRTQAEIQKAVSFMEQSVCLHRLSLQSTELTGQSFSASQCRPSS